MEHTLLDEGEVGTGHNLPETLERVARLRQDCRVIAWTEFDSSLAGDLDCYLCCSTYGKFVLLPCFWPHLVICSPCLCASWVSKLNHAWAQYRILTHRELKIVSLDHDTCCCPGFSRSGDQVQTIPLENITDVGLDARGTGLTACCVGSLPVIFVETAGSGNHREGTTGLGLANYDWFIDQILRQRDMVKDAPRSQRMEARASRGNEQTVEERLAKVQRLFEDGVISKTEYTSKRKDILDSI